MNETTALSWDITIKQISRESCILFVGPELFRMGDKSLMNHIRDTLWDNGKDSQIEFYYPSDGLFLFQKPPHKKFTRYELVDALQKMGTNEAFYAQNSETLTMLAEMPFHLIVTITPDKFISSAFAQHGIEHQTGFLVGGGKAIAPVDKPRARKPLIYNLCGSIDDHESLILDYKDLFTYLRTALDNSILPAGFSEAIGAAESFLFIGFEMQKWYAQLLLQLVQEVSEEPVKYANKYAFEDKSFSTFFEKQFKITPLEEQTVFVKNLHTALKKAGKLRTLKDNTSSPKMAFVRQYVAENDFTNALNEIEKYAPSDELNSIALLKGDNTHFQREAPMMFLSDREVMRLKLADRILKFAESILERA